MAKFRRKDPLVWGIVLIVTGAIFLLENIDVEMWDLVARLWPLILIAWGAWKFYFGLKEREKDIPSRG